MSQVLGSFFISPKTQPVWIRLHNLLFEEPQKPENNTKGFALLQFPPIGKSNLLHKIMSWNEDYRPQQLMDFVGNDSAVKQLGDWLVSWKDQFKRRQRDSGAKKAVLLTGKPGIGKTTLAKFLSKEHGFETFEVNASDSREKADAKIKKGIDLFQGPKRVLIIDELDGIYDGDRGGLSDLIASIKMSKIPIICICNFRFSQKLKSLVNHCLLLNLWKPTKEQIVRRLLFIAKVERLKVKKIAMEELAVRVNGDIRMAINQLEYMSVSSTSVIDSDDIRQHMQNSSKDEDISPLRAVDKLFCLNGGNLRMDERIDLSKIDPDLVPLIIQENYINYRPSVAGEDDNEERLEILLARAAESIGDGDIIIEQIRRYRQWQLSETSCFASSIYPVALLHGQRTTLEQGELNYNRLSVWPGKNSTMVKNNRRLKDLHVRLLASRGSDSGSNSGRAILRLDYLTILSKRLTGPLKRLPKDEGVKKVVEFMDLYSISMEDFRTIVEMSEFKGHPNILDGIRPKVRKALIRAYKKKKLKMLKMKKTLKMKKKHPQMPRKEDEDDLTDPEKKLHSNLESLNSKGGRGSGAASASNRKRKFSVS